MPRVAQSKCRQFLPRFCPFRVYCRGALVNPEEGGTFWVLVPDKQADRPFGMEMGQRLTFHMCAMH